MGKWGYCCSTKIHHLGFLILMQIKGRTVLHVLKILLTLGE